MREYIVPPDNKEEEKIFGAVLTLRQVLWLAAGLFLGIITAVLFTVLLAEQIGIAAGIAVSFSGTPFAFLKKGDLSYDKFLFLRHKHEKKEHVLLYKGGKSR